MRATERQRGSGQQRPAWPGNAMMDPPDTTIVTGAGGWFGQALLSAFTEAGGRHTRAGEIRALAVDGIEASRLGHLPGVVPVVGDVRSRAGLRGLFDGVN